MIPFIGVKRCGRKFNSALGSARTNLDINLGSIRLATTLVGIVVSLYASELKWATIKTCISETVSRKKKPSLQSRASYLRSQKYTISERVQVACKASFLNSLCKLLIVSCTLVNPLASCLWAPVSNGSRTEWSPIRSVIIRVINKTRESDLFNHEYDYRPNSKTRSSVTN